MICSIHNNTRYITVVMTTSLIVNHNDCYNRRGHNPRCQPLWRSSFFYFLLFLFFAPATTAPTSRAATATHSSTRRAACSATSARCTKVFFLYDTPLYRLYLGIADGMPGVLRRKRYLRDIGHNYIGHNYIGP